MFYFIYISKTLKHLRAINVKCLTIRVLEVDSIENRNMSKATRTIKHGARFSRKLQKRLTRRTLAEARALKEQGTECIHIVLYIVELVRLDIYHLLFINHHTVKVVLPRNDFLTNVLKFRIQVN